MGLFVAVDGCCFLLPDYILLRGGVFRLKIQFENVSFRYESRKETESVSTLDFTIDGGEFILICGPSGSGKSTVGRIINDLVPSFYKGEIGRASCRERVCLQV